MNMDVRVAQAVTSARTLETAFHDNGPWTISYGRLEAPAVRFIAEDRIIFQAHFPDACMIDPPADPCLVLRCRGQEISVLPIQEPEDGEFTARWVIPVPEAQRVPIG